MMFAVKIKIGPIKALRNNRWAACSAPSKAYTLLTGHLIRLLVNRSGLSLPGNRGKVKPSIFSLLLNKINHKLCPIVRNKVRTS